jgi:hypothetical protein
VTSGISIALESPWATWKKAPIGRLIPWTSATELLEKAIPPCSRAEHQRLARGAVAGVGVQASAQVGPDQPHRKTAPCYR